MIEHLKLNNNGYGIDVEMGYTSHVFELKCFIDNEDCVYHDIGKSYDDQKAKKEYRSFLVNNIEVQKYLKQKK